MQPETQTRIDAWKNTAKQNISITLTPVTGDPITITEADVVTGGFVLNRYSSSGESIQIGTCVAAELTLRLENGDGRFNSINFEGAELEVQLAPAVGQIPPYETLGYFTVISSPRKLAVIELYALDHMIKFDKPADVSLFNLPNSVYNIMLICATECGVSITGYIGETIPNKDYSVQSIDPVGTMTYRNIMQWCCQIMGCCGHMDDEDKFFLGWYYKPSYPTVEPPDPQYVLPVITAADRYESDFYDNAISITGIKVSKGSSSAMVGTSGYVLSIADNPLIAVEDISTIANNLSTRVGFQFHPFEATVLPMPYLYPLDIIEFVYRGVTYDIGISEVTITANAPTALKGTGKSALAQSYATLNPFSQSEVANISTIISANQNAFSNIVVGGTTISADAETDTLTLVAGSNITLTPNASTDTITIASTGGGGGGGTLTDVQVNGTSVVSGTVANVPVATPSAYGVVMANKNTEPPGGYLLVTSKSGSSTVESYVPFIEQSGGSLTTIRAKFLPEATQSLKGAMSASDKTKLDNIASGAEVNQNAFSNVAVGGTTIQADSKTDTLTLTAGTNITLTPDASNDSVTIAASVPVTDVQTESNGEATSIVSSGIATLPKANSTTYGTVTVMDVAYSSGSGGYVLMNYNGGTVYVPSMGAGNGYVSDNHLPEAAILSTGAFSRKGMAGFSRSTTDHNLGVIYFRQVGGGGADETTYVPVLTASDGTIDASQVPWLSIYPVGSVWETTDSTATPSTIFGGTWQLLGQLVTDDGTELETSYDALIFAQGNDAIKQTYKWERTA